VRSQTAAAPVASTPKQTSADPADEAAGTEAGVSEAEIAELVQGLDAYTLNNREALEDLIAIGGPAVPALIRCLHDTDWFIRDLAAHALGKIGDPSAVPTLIECLNDERESVRCNAIRALGWIGDASAVPELERLLGDPDGLVRHLADEAMYEIRIRQSED